MAASPYFSVIIPTYNRAQFLPQAIRSVLAQQMTNWELIIIDDGSTDETPAVAESFRTDPRIRYHRQTNAELNAARNQGIQLAEGEYLLFLDDDDRFEPDHLQILYAFLSSTEEQQAVVRTGMWVQLTKQRQASSFLDLQAYHPVQQLWLRPTNLLSFAFHHSVFEHHTFAEEFVLGDDFHFLIKVLLDFPLVQLEDFTVTYYQHPQTRTLQYFSPEKAANKFAAMEALWQECGDRLAALIPPNWVSRWRGEQYLHFARLAFRAGAYGFGWGYLRQAISYLSQLNAAKLLKTLGIALVAPFWRKSGV